MKAIKLILIVAIVSIFTIDNAFAWGKKEQGILIGAGAALLLPSLFSHSNGRYYNDRNYYNYGDHNRYYNGYYEPEIRYVKPEVTYIEPPKSETTVSNPTMSHRQQKQHVYVNKINPSDTVVIEYSDGSKTIIQGR